MYDTQLTVTLRAWTTLRTGSPANFRPRFDTVYCVVVGNLNTLRCLKDSKLPILLATPSANKIARYSRYCSESVDIPSPTRSPEAYVDALENVGRKFYPTKAVLFYDGDADLLCISEHRDRLQRYYRFLLPSHQLVSDCLDKDRFTDLATRKNLRVPKSIVVSSNAHSIPSQGDLNFPVIMKPVSRIGWLDSDSVWQRTKGAKGIHLANAESVEQAILGWGDQRPNFLVQELIPGPESNIVSYHAFIAKDGSVVNEYTGRKWRTFPREFGRSSFIEIDYDQEVLREGQSVTESLGLIGAIKIDFKRHAETKQLFLLEVNSRFSIWNYPAALSGANLMETATQVLLSEPVAVKVPVKLGITWVDGSLDRQSWNRGWFSYIAWIVPRLFSRKSVFNVWSWADPMPFFAKATLRLRELFYGAGRRIKARQIVESSGSGAD